MVPFLVNAIIFLAPISAFDQVLAEVSNPCLARPAARTNQGMHL